MARKPRVEFEGASYHVIVRDNQRQKIFRDDRDRLYHLASPAAPSLEPHGVRLS